MLPQTLLIFGATAAALVGVWWIYSRTTLGLALRAAAVQPDGARVVGINVSRVTAATFASVRSALAVSGMASGRVGLCTFSCHQHWKAVAAKQEGVK